MLMFKGRMFRCLSAGSPVTEWMLYDTHYTERYLERRGQNSEGYAAESVLPY